MRKASLFTIFLIVFIDLMGFGIVLPNLQLYGLRFGISSYFALTLMGATYSICQFLFAPVLGKWSDRIGRRPVLIVSQAGTLVGFLILYAAHWFEAANPAVGITLIFASRIIDGISGGNISTASAYIADITTPENRAKGMGIIGAAFGLGFVFGPAIGGIVGKNLGLEWVPILAALFSIAALAMTIFWLPESLDPAHKTPPGELRRFSLLGLRHALTRPAVAPLILMSFVNGFAFAGMEQTLSLLIYLRVFSPNPNGLTPPQLAAAKEIAGENSSLYTGILFFLVGIIIVIVQGGLIHRLTKKFGEARLVITGPALIAIGMLIIALDLPHLFPGLWPWTGFALGCSFLALGSSLFNPSLQSLISRHTPPREQGEILGASQGMASLARATGPIIAGLLFAYLWTNTPLEGSAPYYLSAALCLLVSLWAITIRRRLVPPTNH